jgi:preprotein translocase subunit SecD
VSCKQDRCQEFVNVNRNAVWKYFVLAIVGLAAALYALPNLFGEDPAVQVSGVRGVEVDTVLEQRLTSRLALAELQPKKVGLDAGRLLMRFDSTGQQSAARDVINQELGREYVVALNLASAAPEWLSSLNASPMYLGLDLRGGVHFLLEVDMVEAVKKAERRIASELRTSLREEKLRYVAISRQAQGGLRIRFRDAAVRDSAAAMISRNLPEVTVVEQDVNGESVLVLSLNEVAVREIQTFALQQNITTLRNRVNELGVAEPVIQRQGDDRIVVQLPGVQDTTRAKELLGATATLEFRMLDTEHSAHNAVGGRVPAGTQLFRERNGNPVLLSRRVMLTGDHIIDASSGIEQQSGSPAVFINLDGQGASLFSKRTRERIGQPMATVYIENKVFTAFDSDGKVILDSEGNAVKRRERVEEVINIATIRDQLGARFQITGLDSTSEARDLALLLRAGALAAPIEIIEERTVGPSLGKQNIDQGFLSVMIGFALVLVFMVAYYKLFGVVANLALTFNLVMIVAVLSMLQATLTLPGIAGIVLTVGMAVDANVLIFERIREELRIGNSPQRSIDAGYSKAFTTILDANVTTLIAAVLLFGFGTGPIKGFAITLSIGIATSMFTAIMGTRVIVNMIYGGRRIEKLSI